MAEPLPPDAAMNPTTSLGAETCPATGTCVAVGTYTDTTGDVDGLIETLSGGTWTPTEAPVPANAGANPFLDQNALDAVNCPMAGSCVAVGMYSNKSGDMEVIIETLASGRWIPTALPLPVKSSSSSFGFDDFYAVTCPAVGSCVAVGTYTAQYQSQALIATLAGGTWKLTTAPVPVNFGCWGRLSTIRDLPGGGFVCGCR